MAGGPRQVRSQWQAGRKSRVHLPLSHRLLTAPPLSCGRSRAVSPAPAFRACLGRRSENFFRSKPFSRRLALKSLFHATNSGAISYLTLKREARLALPSSHRVKSQRSEDRRVGTALE